MSRIHPSNWVFILVMVAGKLDDNWAMFLVGFVLFSFAPTFNEKE